MRLEQIMRKPITIDLEQLDSQLAFFCVDVELRRKAAHMHSVLPVAVFRHSDGRIKVKLLSVVRVLQDIELFLVIKS